MSDETIVLSEKEIATIINGGEVIKNGLNGRSISIRESYLKDFTTDLINRKNRVMDTETNKMKF